MKTIQNNKVADHLKQIVTGNPRSAGAVRERTISELLDEAEDREGVYGENNTPVSEDMTVGDLLGWHADFEWEIQTKNYQIHLGKMIWDTLLQDFRQIDGYDMADSNIPENKFESEFEAAELKSENVYGWRIKAIES